MRPLPFGIALALGAAVVQVAAAGESAVGDQLPLAVVDQGRRIAAGELDAVADGLGTPVARGADLARALRRAGHWPTTLDPARVAREFTAAQDEFFRGEHEAARAVFEQLVRAIEGDPCNWGFAPPLRRTAFEARLFLAILARGDGDESAVQRLLGDAARRYPELAPDRAEFPPWLCEEHGRAVEAIADAKTSAEAPAGCSLTVEGPSVFARVDGADLLIESGPGAGEPELFAGLAALTRGLGRPRIAVAIGRPDGLELVLVAAADGRVIRRVDGEAGVARATAEALMAEAVTEPSPGLGGQSEPSSAAVGGPGQAGADPWYHNGLAWAVTGAGLALAGTGFALGRIYGSPSAEEPLAWSLMVAGGAVAGTGVVLFFVPAPGSEDGGGEGLSVGLAASASF